MTRNSRSERISFTNRRVELQNSSELKLQKGRQVGWEDPPSGLLVSRKGTRMPAVGRLFTMLLVKPAETGRGWRSGGWRWSRRTLGRRDLDGVGNLWSPWTGRNPGAGRNQVHLKRFTKIVGKEIHC